MIPVISYVRISTDKQTSLSLDAQTRKIIAYAEIYELEIVESFSETGSAKDIKGRPELQKALKMLKDGKAKGLLISKLDRLTRSTSSLDFLLTKYFKKKYHLFSVAESISTASAVGRFLLNIIIATSQYEREICGERVADAFQTKRINGEYCGGKIPYGYQEIDGKLRMIPFEIQTLAFIEELKVKGLSLKKIANRLNNDKISTRHKRPWNRENLRSILKTANNVI